jgi:hypothetical protein
MPCMRSMRQRCCQGILESRAITLRRGLVSPDLIGRQPQVAKLTTDRLTGVDALQELPPHLGW